MDKKTKIGENFCTHKPQFGLEHTPFLYGQHSPADRTRELFKSALNWERLVVKTEKNNFLLAISEFLAMFTKSQDVLTCFDRSVKTIHGVNVPWELKNQAESLARNHARFKCILRNSTSF